MQLDTEKGTKRIALGDNKALAMQGVQRQDTGNWAPNAILLTTMAEATVYTVPSVPSTSEANPAITDNYAATLASACSSLSPTSRRRGEGGEYNCSGRERACDWETFLMESQHASWGGVLEITALCRGLDLRGWLRASCALSTLKAPRASSLSTTRTTTSTHRHLDPVEREFQQRYETLGGTSAEPDTVVLRGGGRPCLSDCGSVCQWQGIGDSKQEAAR